MEIQAGSTNGFTAKVYDHAGKEITKLPDGVVMQLESTNPGIASVTDDPANPFRFHVVGHRRGSTLVNVRVRGGALDATQSLAITVLGDIAGTLDDPRLKAAELRVSQD
jgi:hypothetical protein